MSKICLCCGKILDNVDNYWHKACIEKMFNTSKIPLVDIDEYKIIDDNLNQGKIVTGVQKKFSFDIHITKTRKTFTSINNEYIIKTQQENLNNIVYYEWMGMKLAKILKIDLPLA